MKGDTTTSEMGVLEPYLDGTFTDEEQNQWNIMNIDKLVSHEQFLKVV